MTQRHFITVIQPAGGVGKTTLTDTLLCLAELAGLATHAIDADGGSYMLSRILADAPDRQPDALGWHSDVDPADALGAHLGSTDVILVDAGANALVGSSSFARFLAGALRSAREAGYTPTVFVPIVPNKLQAGSLVADYRAQFERLGAGVIAVRNDVTGTGAFDAGLELAGTVIDYPRILPAAVELRLRRRVPLAQHLTDPPEGYRRLVALHARALATFAEAPPIRAMFGTEPGKRLRAIAKEAPSGLWLASQALGDVSDGRIDAGEAASLALRQLRRASSDEMLLSAARALQMSLARVDATA